MKLTELAPIWISFGGNARKSGFMFDCPHCRKVRLTCKNIPATIREQMTIARGLGLTQDWIPAKSHFSWSWEGEFENMTVTPSIDASDSGHWHGRIVNGEIQ